MTCECQNEVRHSIWGSGRNGRGTPLSSSRGFGTTVLWAPWTDFKTVKNWISYVIRSFCKYFLWFFSTSNFQSPVAPKTETVIIGNFGLPKLPIIAVSVFGATGDWKFDAEKNHKKCWHQLQFTNYFLFLKLSKTVHGARRTVLQKPLDEGRGVPLPFLPEQCRTPFWHSCVTSLKLTHACKKQSFFVPVKEALFCGEHAQHRSPETGESDQGCWL